VPIRRHVSPGLRAGRSPAPRGEDATGLALVWDSVPGLASLPAEKVKALVSLLLREKARELVILRGRAKETDLLSRWYVSF
jgi:hypothetical protein